MAPFAALMQLLFVLTVNAGNKQEEFKSLPRTLMDLTDPLNALMDGRISSKDFITQTEINPSDAKPSQIQRFSGIYSVDCIFTVNCKEKINKLGNFWNSTLAGNVSFESLILSIKIDIETLSGLSPGDEFVGLEKPDFEPNILFTFHESTTCEDFQNVSSSDWFTLSTFPKNSYGYGIGFNESLTTCKSLGQIVYGGRAFVVLYINFGDTIIVPESFGIFRKRMSYLHSAIVQVLNQFSPQYNYKLPDLWYFPTAHTQKDDNYHQLLITYAKNWPVAGEKGIGLIVKSKLSHSKTEKLEEPFSGFSLISYIKYGTGQWYTPSAIRSMSQHFTSLILEHDHWKIWNSKMRKKLHNTLKVHESNQSLDIILDYSNDRVNNESDFSWEKVENELNSWNSVKYFTASDKNLVLKSIVFGIEKIEREKNKYLTQGDTNFARRMSSNFKVGCTFWPETIKESEAAGVVEACKEINGTFYILYAPDADLKSFGGSPIYYENVVRKHLENVKQFRKYILKHQPDAQVYFEIQISSYIQIRERDYAPTTVFCNEKILAVNEYYEAIVNWAKFNNFPVILKSAMDNLGWPDHQSWLSFLRPSLKHEKRPKVVDLHPSFVLRNYPENINNWLVNRCVDWATSRPEIGVDYFHNNNIGTIFDTLNIKGNGKITEEEYEMMIQFISYRFNFVEVLVPNNFLDFVKVFNLFSLSYEVELGKNFFVSFKMPETIPFEKLHKFFNGLPNQNQQQHSILGIHIDLSKSITFPHDDQQEVMEDSTVIESEILISQGRKKINMGILLNSTACMDTLELLVVRNPIKSSQRILNILNQINYVVCREKQEIRTLIDAENFGKVMDTHLYIKRVFNEFLPHLNIYFRVEVEVLLNENQQEMDTYLRLISHFKQFGGYNDIGYFLVQAFDGEFGNKNGWWTNKNYTDLSNPYSYIEKESVYAGRQMWWPAPLTKRSTSSEQDTNVSVSTVVILSIVFVIMVIFLTGIGAFFYFRYKKVSQFLSDAEVKEFLDGRHQNMDNPSSNQQTDSSCAAEYMRFQSDYEIPILQLQIDYTKLLGAGNFGTVYKGTANGVAVAIKLPNKNCTKGSFKSFLGEIKVLCYIGIHPNIVGFLGAYTKEIHKGILFIATELCSNGSLEGLLRRKKSVVANADEIESTYKNLSSENVLYFHDLDRFSTEIACGMKYLEGKHVVHGDLSTRNVLMDENYTCKIGDFGLSRKIYEYQKYVKKSQEPLPWKWMAYESLTKMEFTSKSDVWSYGVTLWEIYSLGMVPYGAMNWSLEFTNELKNGLRLGKPEFASEKSYNKILDCWNLDIDQRPTFTELAEFFKNLGNTQYTVLCDE